MPVARESVGVMGPDSIMSSALPAGGPSKISVSTTSASSISTMRCAVVDPTNPPPTTVTFFRISLISYSAQSGFKCEIRLLAQQTRTDIHPARRSEEQSDEESLSSALRALRLLCVERFSAVPLLRHNFRLHILNNR